MIDHVKEVSMESAMGSGISRVVFINMDGRHFRDTRLEKKDDGSCRLVLSGDRAIMSFVAGVVADADALAKKIDETNEKLAVAAKLVSEEKKAEEPVTVEEEAADETTEDDTSAEDETL